MLDPAAEQMQCSKQQRERIYRDNIYFTSNKLSENAPEWTYNRITVPYETDEAEETDFEYLEESTEF